MVVDSDYRAGWYQHAVTTDHAIKWTVGESWHCENCDAGSPVYRKGRVKDGRSKDSDEL